MKQCNKKRNNNTLKGSKKLSKEKNNCYNNNKNKWKRKKGNKNKDKKKEKE